MQTYMDKKRAPAAEGRPAPQAAPGEEMRRLSAVQDVDPHAGRQLDLDSAIAARMQEKFGIRMDQVELRESSQASDMDARAFAKGNVVQFAPGQFQPGTQQGQHLIEHELAHVAQQARGNVRADVPGLNVNASESLEHQADMGSSAYTGGEPVSLGGMSAEAAPVQGLFGGIKKFFQKMKRSFNVGKSVKNQDDVAAQITAEHESEQAEMVAAMREQGFSDEEIQAQMMFQRVNQAGQRSRRVQEAYASTMFDSGIETPDELDNTASRLGRGALTKKSRARRAAVRQNVEDNILVGDPEIAQAEQMAQHLSLKRTAHAAANSDEGYTSGAMQAAVNYFAPALRKGVTEGSAGKAGNDPTRFLYLRGTHDEMMPYNQMMTKAGAGANQKMYEQVLSHNLEAMPEVSYGASKGDRAGNDFNTYQNQALTDMEAYLDIAAGDENLMDALRQSADAYSSLGDYDAETNVGGLTGGRAEAVSRAMSDNLLRGMTPTISRNNRNQANASKLNQRLNALMGMQSASMAQTRGEEKEYSGQEVAMHQMLMDFYRRTGLIPNE